MALGSTSKEKPNQVRKKKYCCFNINFIVEGISTPYFTIKFMKLRNIVQRAVDCVESRESAMICFGSTKKGRLDVIFEGAGTKDTGGGLPPLGMCYS